MSRSARVAVFAALFCLLGVSTSLGWQEVQVQGDQVTVTVERDGAAVVKHELQVKIRGGPVLALELEGIGSEVEVESNASVRLARSPQAMWPLAVTLRPDGGAYLKILSERGLRGGTYLFGFTYRTRFRVGREIEQSGEWARVSWIGPRFPSGIDSAKVTMIVPRGSAEPRLPEGGAELGAKPLLTQTRRGERDEVDLVRTHIARGEPAVWAIEVQRNALDGFSAPPRAAPARLAVPTQRERWTIHHSLALAWALVISVLTFFKAKVLAHNAERLGLRAWAFLPLPPLARGFVNFVLLTLSAGLALAYQTTGAAVGGALAAANMVFLFPSRARGTRGPGEWHLVPASSHSPKVRVGGACFDVGRPLGFLLFGALAGSALWLAYRELHESAYRAFLLLCVALLWVPLFFTGRSVDFPEAPLTQARRWLSYLNRRLRSASVRQLELWGRYALGSVDLEHSEVDEARIRVRLQRRPPGLLALEVAFEEGAGRFVVPVLLVRVEDRSLASEALGLAGAWMRGPSPEERVLILRPDLPTPTQVVALVERTVSSLASAADANGPRSREVNSSGKGATTEKATVPAQAM